MHKIQSGGAAPNIQLQLVPKLLAPLVSLWVPHAFVVSFKLETDENILITKARDALKKYKHKVCVGKDHITLFNTMWFLQLVIGNILQTRRTRVVFVTPDNNYELVMGREQVLSGMEIEEIIVSNVVANHLDYIKIQKF